MVDMATALSGTGPTYVFLLMEALVDAGVHLGFSRRVAEELVLRTVEGSAAFARKSGRHLAELRNMVTSPGGTSAAAIYELEKGTHAHGAVARGVRGVRADPRARRRGPAEAAGSRKDLGRRDLLHLEALALVRDLGVRVDRLQPRGAAGVQGLERLRLGNARPQELGVLVGRAFGEEAFEVRSFADEDGGATLRTVVGRVDLAG